MSTHESTTSDRLWTQFLSEHPKLLAHVRYQQIPGADEPVLVADARALRAFAHWAFAHRLTDAAHVSALLKMWEVAAQKDNEE